MRLRCLAVLLLLLALPVVAVGATDSPPCEVPPQFVTAPKPLAPLKAAMAAGDPIEILAVGSGSTTGANRLRPDDAFPYRMLDVLRAAMPQTTFNLTVRGARGLSAEEMLPLVKAQIQQTPAALVLWQTGTVEAIRGLRPARMRQVLREGLDLIRAAGGSLLLIDPEFTRALRANTDVEPYETELQQVAALPGAALFHRYELTRLWVLQGRIDPERAPKDAREADLAHLNRCLGQALADYVLSGARIAAP
jgi:acyl-CoA thioesterase-1